MGWRELLLMAEMATRNRKRKLSEISQNNGKTAR